MPQGSHKEAITVSPSQIGMLLECPRCLWLYFREGLKRPSGPFPSLPGGFDLLFKSYFDSFRKAGKLPPELDGKVDGKLYTDMANLEVWRNARRGLGAKFPDMDLFLHGAIDDVIVRDSGEFVLVDFKTRGFPIKEDTSSHYQIQLDLYALLFKENGYPVADYGYLLFFWPKKYAEYGADFETEVVKMSVDPDRALQTLSKVIEIIRGRQPAAHTNCEFCRFREFSVNE